MSNHPSREDFELEEPFKPPIYHYPKQSAEEKEAASKPWVERAYWQAFGDLGLIRVQPITDSNLQRKGYDRVCHFKNDKRVIFDEKHRPDKDYGDVLIEIYSDMERRVFGWLTSQADYIAHFFHTTRRVVWLPHLLLNKWLKTRKEIIPWVDNPENKKLLPCPPWNRTVYAHNKGQFGYPNYTTASIAGPNELVLGGIHQAMQDLPPKIIPIEDWIAHHRKRGVVLRGPDGRIIDWLWCLSTWDKLGRPVVYAKLGDPFYNLSLYMYPEKISPRQLQGIVAWLKEHSIKEPI